MELFAISCTTCKRRLKVRSLAAIGQILACPKCGSMVQVQPPPGWRPPVEAPNPAPSVKKLGCEQRSSDAARPARQVDPALAAAVEAGVDLEGDVAAALVHHGDETSRRSTALIFSLSAAAVILLVAVVVALSVQTSDEIPAVAIAPPPSEKASTVEMPATAADTEAAVSITDNSAPGTWDSVSSETTDSKDNRAVQAVTPSLESPVASNDEATEQKSTEVDEPVSSVPVVVSEPVTRQDKSEPTETEDVSIARKPVALKRTPPPQIDVQARLNDRVAAIEFAKITLGRFVDVLSRMSAIPMTFDVDALVTLNVNTEAEISVSLTDTTVGEALDHVLDEHKLGYVIKDRQVLITYPQSMTTAHRRVRYDVSDLLGPGEDIDQFARLLQQFVSPASWPGQGGHGRVATEGNVLLVDQSEREHWYVFAFCEKLRRARGLPLRGGVDDERISIASRRARAKSVLVQTVRLNFAAPAPLAYIARRLGESSGAQILLDGPALAAEGLALDTDAQLEISGGPLSEALSRLTTPLGLSVRMVSSSTVQVTSARAIAEGLELEFHPVDDLLSAANPGDRIVSRIQERLAASSWAGGGGRGEIHFDEPSAHLLVLQSQDVQVRLEKLLAEWRSAGQVALR